MYFVPNICDKKNILQLIIELDMFPSPLLKKILLRLF